MVYEAVQFSGRWLVYLWQRNDRSMTISLGNLKHDEKGPGDGRFRHYRPEIPKSHGVDVTFIYPTAATFQNHIGHMLDWIGGNIGSPWRVRVCWHHVAHLIIRFEFISLQEAVAFALTWKDAGTVA